MVGPQILEPQSVATARCATARSWSRSGIAETHTRYFSKAWGYPKEWLTCCTMVPAAPAPTSVSFNGHWTVKEPKKISRTEEFLPLLLSSSPTNPLTSYSTDRQKGTNCLSLEDYPRKGEVRENRGIRKETALATYPSVPSTAVLELPEGWPQLTSEQATRPDNRQEWRPQLTYMPWRKDLSG